MAVRVDMLYGGGAVDPIGVSVHNLTLRNFSGDSLTAGSLRCRKNNPCTGVRFEGVVVNTTGDPSSPLIPNGTGWLCEGVEGTAAASTVPPLDPAHCRFAQGS
jgi:hypothetical protein